jgi:hypothetical protein
MAANERLEMIKLRGEIRNSAWTWSANCSEGSIPVTFKFLHFYETIE